jgi:hypothetical protein
MKPTNLNMLFQDQIRNFSHLVTSETQTKNDFLTAIKQNYSLNNPKVNLFFIACEKSDFETIKLNANRDAILFNQ